MRAARNKGAGEKRQVALRQLDPAGRPNCLTVLRATLRATVRWLE